MSHAKNREKTASIFFSLRVINIFDVIKYFTVMYSPALYEL